MVIYGYACERGGLPPLAEQRASIKAWASELGIGRVRTLADELVSITSGRTPTSKLTLAKGGAAELIELVGQAPDAVVIVATIAALERDDVPELEMIGARVIEAGVDRIEAPPEPEPEPAPKTSPAEVQSRLILGRRAAAAAGRHQSGPTPYGYQRGGSSGSRVIVEEPGEAAVVRSLFADYLRLGSMEKLVASLAERGLRTRRGKPWSRAGVSWILKNETYLGRVHYAEIRAQGIHRALIEPGVFRRVAERILANTRRGRRARRAAGVAA